MIGEFITSSNNVQKKKTKKRKPKNWTELKPLFSVYADIGSFSLNNCMKVNHKTEKKNRNK